MKLGIGSYTYVWSVGVPGFPAPAEPMTAGDLLRKATALGVDVVQIADNLPLHRLGAAELHALRADADARGLALEVGTVGIEPENLLRYAAIAQQLASPILRTVIDHGAARPTPDEVVARLSTVIGEFERAGVTLALENHDRFKAATLRAIIERLGSARVGVCLDTANSLGCMEGPEHLVETLGLHVVNVHIKDACVVRLPHLKGFTVEGRPAGQGQVDIPWLLRRLRAFDRNPNAIVELWPPPEVSIGETVAKENAWAQQSVAYLRTLIPASPARASAMHPPAPVA